MPRTWKVIVSADRGLYADWLYEEIVAEAWHPFLRINHQGQYRCWNSSLWQPLNSVVTTQDPNWSGQITCFKTNPINCTLLARWDDGYTDPWLMRGQSPLAARRRSARMRCTDLKPAQANVSWAARSSVQVASSDALGDSALRFRSWIECSYRDIKSDGWQWHKTRLRQPERAERHWLAQSLRLRSSSAGANAPRSCSARLCCLRSARLGKLCFPRCRYAKDGYSWWRTRSFW